jgi:hypothetical protein
VVVLLINVDASAAVAVDLGPLAGAAATLPLDAAGLGARQVRLAGVPLAPAADGSPPALAAMMRPHETRVVQVPALSISFVVLPEARAPACAQD